MILLDTNVISELMRPEPHAGVQAWLAVQKTVRLGVTAITIAEIEHGILRLPTGKRRNMLKRHFSQFVAEAFTGRVYAFDEEAAYRYGALAAQREKEGFNTDAMDLMIAAIVSTQGAAIATRNIKDFEGCGIDMINPWKNE